MVAEIVIIPRGMIIGSILADDMLEEPFTQPQYLIHSLLASGQPLLMRSCTSCHKR